MSLRRLSPLTWTSASNLVQWSGAGGKETKGAPSALSEFRVTVLAQATSPHPESGLRGGTSVPGEHKQTGGVNDDAATRGPTAQVEAGVGRWTSAASEDQATASGSSPDQPSFRSG